MSQTEFKMPAPSCSTKITVKNKTKKLFWVNKLLNNTVEWSIPFQILHFAKMKHQPEIPSTAIIKIILEKYVFEYLMVYVVIWTVISLHHVIPWDMQQSE